MIFIKASAQDSLSGTGDEVKNELHVVQRSDDSAEHFAAP